MIQGLVWAPLSSIVNINDGAGTYLSGPPLFNFFPKLYKKVKRRGVLEGLKTVRKVLSDCEFKYDKKNIKLNRAGQILTFHGGEQVHCGVSTNYKCSFSGDLLSERVVIFLPLVPTKFLQQLRKVELVDTETPWGLQKGGVQECQVVFVCVETGGGN